MLSNKRPFFLLDAQQGGSRLHSFLRWVMAAREDAVNLDDDFDDDDEEEEEEEEDERSILVALLWTKCLYRDIWRGVIRQHIT